MAGIKALIGLAFAGCIGLTFLVLGCALPDYNKWWPLFVLVFYILSPIPITIAKRFVDDMSGSSAVQEFALFITTGIVISAFGLPIVLASTEIIHPGSCGFTLAANIVIYLTILAYFYVHSDDDDFGGSVF